MFRFPIVLTLLVSAAVVAPGWAVVEIEFQSKRARVTESMVYLQDIANVRGDTKTKDRVNKLDITELTEIGAKDRITHDLLRTRLLLARIPENHYRLKGFETVQVERIKKKSVDEVVADAVVQAFSAAHNVDPKSTRIDVRLIQPINPQYAVAIERGATITVVESRIRLGRNHLQFGLMVDGRTLDTFQAPVHIRLYRNVAVALTNLKPGDTIESADVSVEERYVDDDAILGSTENVVGFKVLKALHPDDLITKYDASVYRNPDRRGEIVITPRKTVEAVYQKGAIRVSAKVETLDKGAIGDTIRVKNKESNRVFNAVVRGPSQVIVR